MFFKNRTAIAALMAGVLLAPGAMAQQTSGNLVVSLDGPAGSVLVLRGNETFSLVAGDTLFEGDKVFTRSNGAVKITFSGCEQNLVGASSIEIGAAFCNATPFTLAQNDVVGGVTIGASGGGGIGATPILLGLLGAGGVAAAAGGGGNPASP